ncbi:hypothetical protein O1611_g7777 [Lasiodiplodia mahajangana]|uniref:Uncharacterized protein n=1 Tax=Lasiodiplodia mahajangana TaxID=1108764 RepID=A0ACC2JEH9_9PEZI|nr:hypothetical protein O1611_g7777 [Lasiodiplodia mahajangana]
MSEKRRINRLEDDVWRKNTPTLRRLYLEERRTLKAVKEAMENEHGFPATPLSTYEVKLRDLGLRKKMKKKDWHTVHQHYVQSGGRHTAISLNGVRIPWKRAWKEIRRSGSRELIDCRAMELPVGVVMRSPSPDPRSINPLFKTLAPWDLSDISLEGLSPAILAYRSKLYDIPSNLLRIEMLNNSQQLFTGITTTTSESSLLHQSSTLSHQGLKDLNLNSNTARLSAALYWLANHTENNFVREWPENSLDRKVNVVINLTPKHVLLNVLAVDSPTIRAALQPILLQLGKLGWKDDFVNLVEATWRLHPTWTVPLYCLEYAANFDSVDCCRTLLQMVRWSKHHQPEYYQSEEYSSMILRSIAQGHIDCAKIIYQHLIESHTTIFKTEYRLADRIFCDFLIAVAVGSVKDEYRTPIKLEDPVVLPMLDWFLEHGANVDILAEEFSRDINYRYTHKNWMPTILDRIYFLDDTLYSLLVSRSVKFRTEPTRSGIHHSASKGIESLRGYLLSRPSYTPAKQDVLVDFLLVEEILRLEDSDFEVIRTLLNYSLGFQTLGLNVSAMLYHIIGKARKQGIHPAVYDIVNTLIQGGAKIVAETMKQAVGMQGTALLQLLFSHGADFKSQGALALSKAAQIGNYDAVDWLLDTGIDSDSTLSDGSTIIGGAYTTTYRTVQIFDHKWVENPPDIVMDCAMLEYLISHNFKLRNKQSDTSPRPLLCWVLKNWSRDNSTETQKKIQFILDAEPLVDEQPNFDQCPFEALFFDLWFGGFISPKKVTLMDVLLNGGISMRNSGVLGYLFRNYAPDTSIQKALDSGADIDTYCGRHKEDDPFFRRFTPLQAAAGAGSLYWVQFLIQKGADVNKPAKGFGGRTALQAACDRNSGEYSRNIDLIKFLISSGANVNAPPASKQGITAIQGAAIAGDFEAALLLLENGADINAPGAETGGCCALDGAVYCHRLDMVQFLLDLGALSHDRGESGYRGAIRMAEMDGHHVITDLIRQHASKNGKSGEELSVDWDYPTSGYTSEADDLDEVDDVGIWNQTNWEDWLPL